MSRQVDPLAVQAAVLGVRDWLLDETQPVPERAALAAAVRLSTRVLAALAPGSTVEVRVPPFVAVQCISGPRHTRGTPPNVVETDPRTWLLLVTGLTGFEDAAAAGRLSLSGSRAGAIASLFPLVSLSAVETRDTSHADSRFDPPSP